MILIKYLLLVNFEITIFYTLKSKTIIRQVSKLVGINIGENENIDRALKRFKKKYERSGVLKEYKKRTFFTKPSIEKRMEKIKAKRRAYKENLRARR